MTALWCMRSSPIFIHSQPITTHIENLLLAEFKLTSSSVVSRRVTQNRVDVRNHLCYAYQMQRDFKKATEIGESAVDLAASGRVHTIYTCCATGLLAESYLFSEKYESAKGYAHMAVLQHKQIFGCDMDDGSISAWRRRNMTIMAIACAYLTEFELAEVIPVSVYVEAVRFDGPDEDLSLHAHHNLECLHKVKAKHNQRSTMQSDGACLFGEEDID